MLPCVGLVSFASLGVGQDTLALGDVAGDLGIPLVMPGSGQSRFQGDFLPVALESGAFQRIRNRGQQQSHQVADLLMPAELVPLPVGEGGDLLKGDVGCYGTASGDQLPAGVVVKVRGGLHQHC